MTIFGIFGGIGSGKTLCMVYLLAQDRFKRKKDIVTNIKLGFKHSIIDNEFMQSFPNLENTSGGFDEIHNILDSRSSTKKENKHRTHFILQSRHAGKGSFDMYYTTQFIGQVDLRLRDNTDVRVYPQILTRDADGKPVFMLIEYHFIKGQRKEIVREYINAGPICDLYDTHEVVELDI